MSIFLGKRHFEVPLKKGAAELGACNRLPPYSHAQEQLPKLKVLQRPSSRKLRAPVLLRLRNNINRLLDPVSVLADLARIRVIPTEHPHDQQ